MMIFKHEIIDSCDMRCNKLMLLLVVVLCRLYDSVHIDRFCKCDIDY